MMHAVSIELCEWIKGLITVGRELRQQYPSDLLSGGDVPRTALSGRPGAGQQITRVLLP